MISDKTVLILGAGASYPYYFPLAREMVLQLNAHPTEFTVRNPGFNDDGMLYPLHPTFRGSALAKFRADLNGSALDSIDSFLTARPEYAEVGKAAIAATLIPFENPDHLKSAKYRGGDWYRYLRNQMGESYEDFAESARHLSVVTFNYDRSFEYFFFDALTASYGESRALDALKEIKIVHVYGQLGKPHFLSADGRPFSPELNSDAVAKCVADIKVIPENRDGSPEFQEAAALIESAERICFLGFGYNATNMKRLAIKKHLPGTGVWGSMFGMKPAEREKAFSLIQTHMHNLDHNYFGKENEDSLLFLRSYPVL